MENAAQVSGSSTTDDKPSCAGCDGPLGDDVHCAACVERISTEIDREYQTEAERSAREYTGHASKFVREWARDKLALGLINREVVEALELCADDLEDDVGF